MKVIIIINPINKKISKYKRGKKYKAEFFMASIIHRAVARGHWVNWDQNVT